LHSRVARSNIHLLTKLGANVKVAGPGTLVPSEIEHIAENNLLAASNVEEAISGADVVMILRIQRERQDSAYFPTLREYAIHYG
ncbi:aspartate carbamoyltransferase, partial [Escherichia coli]|nr:aspartate carbamoyltransferase [Escherichia coli]